MGPVVLLSSGGALAVDGLPPVQTQNAISYYSGGIGLDESAAIKADSLHHSLLLEFIEQHGRINEYSAGQKIQIDDNLGKNLLSVTSDGPFLTVDLPRGRFKITATAFGISQVRYINLEKHPSEHIIFTWPAQSTFVN